MPQTSSNASASSSALSKDRPMAGYILSGLAIAFLLFDTVIKILKLPVAMEATSQLGYPGSVVMGIGLVQLVAVIAYAVPQTSVLGAILLTAHLGGAIASHVRVGNPLASHVLFPVYVALFVWGGLFLRDAGLRALIPLRSPR